MLEFTVIGKPIPASRPRFRGHAYKTQKDRDYQRKVAIEAMQTMTKNGLKKPLDKPVGMVLEFTCWMKGDAENLAKNVMDAMNGLVYRDDVQVEDLHIILDRHPQSDAKPYKVGVKVWEL